MMKTLNPIKNGAPPEKPLALSAEDSIIFRKTYPSDFTWAAHDLVLHKECLQNKRAYFSASFTTWRYTTQNHTKEIITRTKVDIFE